MERRVEDDHVDRVAGEPAEQRLWIARGSDDVESEVVEKPAESLGQQRTLMGYYYSHVVGLLPGRLHRHLHDRQRTGKCMGIFLSPSG
jgi:hypothetical protein